MSRVTDEPDKGTVRIALGFMGKSFLSREDLRTIFNLDKKKKPKATAKKPKQAPLEAHKAKRRKILAQTLKRIGYPTSDNFVAMLEPAVVDVGSEKSVLAGIREMLKKGKKGKSQKKAPGVA